MQAEYQGLTFARPGHASVRIETREGLVMYLDPWSEVIEGTSRDADYVFATHDDYDHYDPDAIRAVSTDTTLVVLYDQIQHDDLELDVLQLGVPDETTIDDIQVRTVPAYNQPDGNHVRENGDPYHPEGEGIGILLTIDGVTVFYPGDTDFLDVHRDVNTEVLIPPIGGRPTMDRHEAADMVRAIGPDLVLPVHYNTDQIGGIDTDPEAFQTEVESGGARVVLF